VTQYQFMYQPTPIPIPEAKEPMIRSPFAVIIHLHPKSKRYLRNEPLPSARRVNRPQPPMGGQGARFVRARKAAVESFFPRKAKYGQAGSLSD